MMAFGLNSESVLRAEQADDRFIANVERALGRKLTGDEEGIAIDVRDQGGYTAEEAATEIAACAC